MRAVCFICGRVKAGTENEPDNPVTHGLCAKCSILEENYLGVPFKDLFDSARLGDPEIKSALEFAKDGIRDELKRNIKWIGKEKTYSEEVDRLYGELFKEVESEATGEVRREINKK